MMGRNSLPETIPELLASLRWSCFKDDLDRAAKAAGLALGRPIRPADLVASLSVIRAEVARVPVDLPRLDVPAETLRLLDFLRDVIAAKRQFRQPVPYTPA